MDPNSPSAEENPDVNAESSTAEDVNSQSSSSEDANDVEPKTVLDIVTDVVDKSNAQDSSSEDGQETDDTPDDAKVTAEDKSEEPAADVEAERADADATESTDDPEPVVEDADLPFGKHPRFKALLSERDEWRGKAEAETQAAEQYRQVESFLVDNSLDADDAAGALELAAKFKAVQLGQGNPDEVLRLFDSYRDQLTLMTGQKLPADLQTQVDTGELSLEAAQRIARADQETIRTAKAREHMQAQTEAERKRQESDAAAKRQEALVSESTRRLAEWETGVRKSDPDYERKSPLVQGVMLRMSQANGPVQTADEAIELVKAAYAEVTKSMTPARRKPDTPTAPSSERPSSGKGPEPKNTLDVINQTLAASG